MLRKSYSHTSFAGNWCEQNWWELYNVKTKQIYAECFERYKNASFDHLTYADLYKFIVHYIAAVPELRDIKWELNDNPTFELIIEGIAEDLITELLHLCCINIQNESDLIIDKNTFINDIICELGSAKYLRHRVYSLCVDKNRRLDTENYEKSKQHSRKQRMNIFRRKCNVQNASAAHAKSSDRFGSATNQKVDLVHDDIVSYRRVFEDVLILYPIGKMLKQNRARICKLIISTMETLIKTESDIQNVKKWIYPALKAHKIPIQSDAARQIAQSLTLKQYKERSVVFLKGEEAKTFFIILYGAVAVINGSLCNGDHVFTLQKGSGFGGLALASDEAQSNSTICSSDCLIAALSKKDYNNFMQPSYEPNPKEKYKTLKRCDLLKSTPLHLLKELSLFAITKFFKRNSVILQQGNVYDDGVYFVKSGTLRVVRELRKNVFVDADKLGIAESFGWECLLTAFGALSSVIAEGNVVLYLIPKTHILHKLDAESLQNIFTHLSDFPSDLEMADNLLLSQRWIKYRKNLFDQVKGCRSFKTHRIIDKDRGALTTSSDLAGFPFRINEQLDVAIESVSSNQKDGNGNDHHSKTPKKKKWNTVKSMFHTPSVLKSLDIAINESLKVQIKEGPHQINQSNEFNRRPTTPRSFRIITQRNKHKYNYYHHRKRPTLLKLPGYSWLNSDQQKSVMQSYRDNRSSWLIQSNAEEEEKQKHQKLLFAKMKQHRADQEEKKCNELIK